jgi:hypothetical protein
MTVRAASWNLKQGLRVFHSITFTRQISEIDDGKFVVHAVSEVIHGRVTTVPLLSDVFKRTFDVRARVGTIVVI